MLQTLVHYSLHFLFPGLLARLVYPLQWQRAWLVMLATMLVDADHLLATPIFDPHRCSIGFHPLHTWPAIALYIGLLVPARTRVAALGLVLHMCTDYQDCLWR